MVFRKCDKCAIITHCERMTKKLNNSGVEEYQVYHHNTKITKSLKYYIPAILFFSLVIFWVIITNVLGNESNYLIGIVVGAVLGFSFGIPFYLIGILHKHRAGGSKFRCVVCETRNKNIDVSMTVLLHVQKCSSCGYILNNATYCHVCPQCEKSGMVYWS